MGRGGRRFKSAHPDLAGTLSPNGDGSVPGSRLSDISRKADLVIVAARIDASSGRLTQAQAYERRGAVWSDVLLLDREALLARLSSRRKVYSGAPNAEVPGDFIVRGEIRLQGADGRAWLALGTTRVDRDDLGIPVF